MMSQNPTRPSFLSFDTDTFGAHTSSMAPKVYVTADDDDFDTLDIQHLRDEGFDARYLSYGQGGKPYKDTLRHLADDLELGENYAIV
ncbi:hypothetical protein B0A55_11340, partial [Friedmanniomyces simplex]